MRHNVFRGSHNQFSIREQTSRFFVISICQICAPIAIYIIFITCSYCAILYRRRKEQAAFAAYHTGIGICYVCYIILSVIHMQYVPHMAAGTITDSQYSWHGITFYFMVNKLRVITEILEGLGITFTYHLS